MVIAIHVSGPLAEQLPDFNTWEWWYVNWWDGVSRSSVPIFVLLSGAFLLTKDYPTIPFIKKRLSKVLIPGVFWMCVYMFYSFLAKKDPATVKDAAIKLMEGPVHYHLWFIYLIVGLYFMYPILRPWVRQATDTEYWYVFILAASGAWLCKILWVFWGLRVGIYWETFTNNVGYFILGAYLIQKPIEGDDPHPTLRPWPLSRKQMGWVAIALVVVGSTITVVGTYFASMWFKAGKFHNYFYDYLTPNVGMAIIGWFLLAKIYWNKKPLLEIEKEFAGASFGIYLVHVLVMDWWAQCGYWFGAASPYRSVPIVVGLVAITAFLVVKFIKALPGGEKIV